MKELLLFRGGVRSDKKTLSDGNEHTLYYKARTPTEVALFVGAERRYAETEAGDLMREKTRAKFIAASLCDEGGSPLLTEDEALLIPATLKPEICWMVIGGSNTAGEAGKA
jgi:hypothetical protein